MSRRAAFVLSVGLLSALTLTACGRSESQTAAAPAASGAASTATVQATPTPPNTPAPAITEEDAAYEQERQAQLARAAADPVVGVIERAELCLHFGGEEGFDAARRAQIDRAFADNRCDTVVADGDALRASRPQDAARIDAALRDLR